METLKKYWWVILIIIVLLVFGVQKCKNNKLKDQIQLQNVELSVLNDSVSIYKNKVGNLTSSFKAVEIEKGNLKKSLELAGFDIKEWKNREIKWRDTELALRTQIEASGHGTTVLHDTIRITRTDTIKQANFKWNNRYLYLTGNVNDKILAFDYKYKTGIDIVNTVKGKTNLISVYLSDPNAIVTTGNSIVVIPKKTWCGWKYIQFGAGLGVGYLIFK